MLRKLIAITAFFAFALGLTAEPMRTHLTKEKKLPKQFHFDTGLFYQYSDLGIDTGVPGVVIDGDVTEITPYARFGITDALAVRAYVPFVSSDISNESNSGLGDVGVDLELMAWEDIFGYPWIMPYLSWVSSTGNEEKNLGTGDSSWTVGAAIGTTTFEKFIWILDAGYEFNSDYDNRASVGMGLIWELSEEFALVGEIGWTEYSKFLQQADLSSSPVLWELGFNYKISEMWDFSIWGGQETDGIRDAVAGGRVSAQF